MSSVGRDSSLGGRQRSRREFLRVGVSVLDNLPVMGVSQPFWIYGVSPKLKMQAYPMGQLPMLRMQLSQ